MVAIQASWAAGVGAAVDLLGLLLLLVIGPDTGYSETTVTINGGQDLAVPLLLDVLTIAGAGMTGQRARQARGSSRVWALVTFGVNVSYRALTALIFWVAASDTGEGQPVPDYSRSWVLCGGVVVLVATVVMVGSLASPSALRFLAEAEALREGDAGDVPRPAWRDSPAVQVLLVLAVGIISLLGTGFAVLILVSRVG
jgi:hypothetical protein